MTVSFSMPPCSMPGIEAVIAITRHAYPKHFHAQFGIGLIEQGAQKSLSGRGQVEAGPGDIITVNPGEVHDGSPIGEQSRSWRMLYLEPAVVAATIGDLAVGNTHYNEFSSPALADAIAADSFRTLFNNITCSSHHSLQQEQALLILLVRLLHVSEPREAAPVLHRARERLDDDPASPVTLAELARLCDMNRFQLLRSFQRATGITPHAYQIQRRIQLAQRLIAAGTPLAESAVAAGFADQSHMSRQFSRALGVSPGTYASNKRRS